MKKFYNLGARSIHGSMNIPKIEIFLKYHNLMENPIGLLRVNKYL